MHEYRPGSTLPEHFSARKTFSRAHFHGGIALAAVLIAGAVALPHMVMPTVITAIALFYLVSVLDRNLLLLRGFRQPSLVVVRDEEALAIPDDELPVYTILLPVYNEPSIVQNLIDGVGKLVYPKGKLETLLLVEEDDHATREAVRGLDMESVRVVIVPHSEPKTKPKACNYGMSLPGLRGELVTIYDAEDIPDPLQLRKAVAAFRRLPPDVACLQARLGYFNERQNLLTRWFSQEYDQWFGLVLPTVEASGCVVPLGGTSNHLKTEVWREVGGWDEFNVTEDADLGVRLARHGYRTLVLDSTTLEEANSDVLNWIRQRSRWYKGYLQTMLVHLRHPRALHRELGTVAVLRLVNMTGGVPVTGVINLALWGLLALWINGRAPFIAMMFQPLPYYICLTLFLVAGPASVFMSLMTISVLGKPHLWWATLLTPIYWFLQSVAAVKAMYQLLFRPHFWEKTVHGLAHPMMSPAAGDTR
ncbi:glycosyltransferase family 2 protein [Mycolicibacterium phlei]|jgi:cellulose synthase/poly-beta-1,6-N-acetylglucosamine synthase-like glycosyltransferase